MPRPRSLPRRLARFLFVILALLVTGLAAFRLRAIRYENQSGKDGAPAGGRFVKAADVEVFLQEAGDPKAPAVLFIHGTGAWSETWRSAMTAVAAAGFHAVALDLPPFGYSQRPDPPSYGKREQGRRIIGVLDALGLQQAILVGHSFGGGPTMEAALFAPDRVRALVLVDVALGLGSSGESSALVKGLLAVTPLRDSLVAMTLTNPAFSKRLLQGFVANPDVATDERVAVYQRPMSRQGTTTAFGHWLPQLLAPPQASASESDASYAALTIPVRLIWGDKDTITPLSQGQHIQGVTPGAQLEVMSGVGHIPQIEAPEAFNALLVRLISPFQTPKSPDAIP